ncbi:MAG: spike base protein, RCAP_Rcc01079 family [Pikeienuella sp.]
MTVNMLYGWGAGSAVVTPSDSATFAQARGFMVDTDGAAVLVIRNDDGTTSDLTVPACKAGIQYAFTNIVGVKATGTTATSVLVGR